MKLKLNLPIESQIEDTVYLKLKRKEKQELQNKQEIINLRYYRNDSYKIIDRILKTNIGTNWDTVYNKLIANLKPEDIYCIDQCVYRKNVNGDFIDSYGKIRKIFKSPGKISRKIYPEYYIEDNILKCNQPLTRFKNKTKKVISKKINNNKVHIVKYDYDIIYDGGGDIKKFIEMLEQNKKTYRVREIKNIQTGILYNRNVRR